MKKELVPALNLTFAGALKFSCLNDELLKKTWASLKLKGLMKKEAPADYLFKVICIKGQEQGLPYDSFKTNMLLEQYGISSSAPLAGEKPQAQELTPRQPQATPFVIRDIDIETEYFKFERAKAENKVHVWVMEAYGRPWNPFTARFLELVKDGKAKDRPMAYHIDIQVPKDISPLDLMVDVAKVTMSRHDA